MRTLIHVKLDPHKQQIVQIRCTCLEYASQSLVTICHKCYSIHERGRNTSFPCTLYHIVSFVLIVHTIKSKQIQSVLIYNCI